MLQQLATTYWINIIFLLDSFTITFKIGLFMAPRKECVQCSGLLQVQSRPISVFYERNISTACRAIELGSGADVDCCRIVRSQCRKWFTWVVTTTRGPSEADVDDTWLIFTMQSSGSGNHHTADFTCYRECIPWSPGRSVTIWVNEET